MARTVKQKIRTGTLFLFFLTLLSGGIGIYHLLRLKSDSKVILKDNYESLEYCHAMQRALDSLSMNEAPSFSAFDSILNLQESNITEYGEKEATELIRKHFELHRKGDSSFPAIKYIRENIQKVLSVNMAAIEAKNQKANKTADKALTYLSFLAAIIFLIGFTFSFNFPAVLTAPIISLTEGIHEITKKNYHHRIHLERKDEFGQMADAFNDMADRLEYFENSNLNKIIFEKTRAEAVINSLKEASIGLDKSGIVLFANDQALQLLGMQAKDMVGQLVEEISKRNDLLRFLLEEKGNMPFKIVVDNRENYFTKEVMDIPQDGANNRVIVLRNITSFKELDVAKTNFIATISHELKTPLASSDFSLKLLEDKRLGILTTEQKELIQQIKNDNHRMIKILSELLNMSQVEAGKIQLNVKPVSPTAIIESSIMAVKTAAREKEVIIEQNIEKNLGSFSADPDKIGWVLNNFLTNAIHYSPTDAIVSIAAQKANNYISFSVTDHGIGIDPVYIDRIFERYFQVPDRSDKKGSGIGLAICKDFIEAMGGRIWVQSQIGQGSTFGFDIPND